MVDQSRAVVQAAAQFALALRNRSATIVVSVNKRSASNQIKVVQRVPVEIAIDFRDLVVRPLGADGRSRDGWYAHRDATRDSHR
ncbi:hypothetical protein C7H84_00335 [Burkholderia sp. Nafp2/4-1b]|uniref:hypothetical protein n=1 Tax=Burkholderia sp. Nafp2/4-1b TaxID=2116686 RepID=UPI000EF8B409|nr:hypothetical protein [Burkholderia sp. Nafp2/4-1b]RKU04653.1 hypothetical protein C7H84_00335 [Burkholderia sp. Nafp2/4-1b]